MYKEFELTLSILVEVEERKTARLMNGQLVGCDQVSTGLLGTIFWELWRRLEIISKRNYCTLTNNFALKLYLNATFMSSS